MASPSNPVFPSPPASWPLPPPPPPPSSAPAASSKKRLLFELEVKQVGLLQKALRSLVFTATCPESWPLAGTGKIRHSGKLYILKRGAFLVAKTILKPGVDTCLALKRSGTYAVSEEREVRFNLRLLLEEMENTVADDGEGLTLFLKAEKQREIVYSLNQEENDNDEVPSSVIPVISTKMGGDRLGSDWSELEASFVLSFKITPQSLNRVMDLIDGSPAVRIKVTQNIVRFEVDNRIILLRRKPKRISQYKILERKWRYPFVMEFSFNLREAIMNAVDLSDHVIFNQINDLRCCLKIPVNGLGSIYFCFDRNQQLGKSSIGAGPSSDLNPQLPLYQHHPD